MLKKFSLDPLKAQVTQYYIHVTYITKPKMRQVSPYFLGNSGICDIAKAKAKVMPVF